MSMRRRSTRFHSRRIGGQSLPGVRVFVSSEVKFPFPPNRGSVTSGHRPRQDPYRDRFHSRGIGGQSLHGRPKVMVSFRFHSRGIGGQLLRGGMTRFAFAKVSIPAESGVSHFRVDGPPRAPAGFPFPPNRGSVTSGEGTRLIPVRFFLFPFPPNRGSVTSDSGVKVIWVQCFHSRRIGGQSLLVIRSVMWPATASTRTAIRSSGESGMIIDVILTTYCGPVHVLGGCPGSGISAGADQPAAR